jgi:hypothetical protein
MGSNKYIPLDSKKKLYKLYIIKKLPLIKIALIYGCDAQTVSNHLKRYNIPRRKPNYKGGIKYSNGYRLLRRPNHPRASNGYVPEHILIMEKRLGRYLEYYGFNNSKNEVIHHIDGNKLNQKISNLLLTKAGEHIGFHSKIRNKNITPKRDKYGRFFNPLLKTPPKKCFKCGRVIGKKRHICVTRKIKKGRYQCCICKKFLKKNKFAKDRTKKIGIEYRCKECSKRKKNEILPTINGRVS